VPRKPRGNSFLFDVDRFEFDPVVAAMSPRARAYYARLLLRLWKQPEPGVIPNDDRLLSALCEAGADWDSIASDIRTAFDAESRPGFLVQPGTVRTHEAQTVHVQGVSERRRAAAIKRWDGMQTGTSGMQTDANACKGMLGSGSGSEKKEEAQPALAGAVPLTRSGKPVPISDLLGNLVGSLAQGPPPDLDPEAPAFGFDSAAVSRRFSRLPGELRSELETLAAWLWKTGTKRMDLIVELLEHVRRNQVDNPYAYLATGSQRRAEIESKELEAIHEREKKARARIPRMPQELKSRAGACSDSNRTTKRDPERNTEV